MKHRIPVICVICAILLSAASPSVVRAQLPADRVEKIRQAAPDRPRVAPQEARTVLIWNTPAAFMEKDPHKGYCIPYGQCAMSTLGVKTGAFTPVVSDDISTLRPENLKRFDAIIMNNSSNRWIRPTASDMPKLENVGETADEVEQVLRKSLLEFVARGGGIVAYHYAIGANPRWREFHELIGARVNGHPWNEEVGVRVEEPDHPLVAAFGGSDFRLHDEIFQYQAPYDRNKVRVLLSLDTKTTNMDVPWIHRTDGDFALAWVKQHGAGRVFYTTFGHRTECYWNPKLLQFYLDGIQFACGDLEAPCEPR